MKSVIACLVFGVLSCSVFLLASSCEEPDVPPPEIFAVEPNSLHQDSETYAAVIGENFVAENGSLGFRVFIDDMEVSSDHISYVDEERLEVIIPAGLELGVHDLTVVTPGDQVAMLQEAFEVFTDADSDD